MPKETISEQVAVQRVLTKLMEAGRAAWLEFLDDIAKINRPGTPLFAEGSHPEFEFLIAVIAVQFQAVEHLFEADQAGRLRNIALGVLTKDIGDYPRQAVGQYQLAWNEALGGEGIRNPIEAVAGVFFDRLRFRLVVDVGGAAYYDPLAMLALMEKLAFAAGHSWKEMADGFDLVPAD